MISVGIMDTKKRDVLDFIPDHDLNQNSQMHGARKNKTKQSEMLEFFNDINFEFSQKNQMDNPGKMDSKERDVLDFIPDHN